MYRNRIILFLLVFLCTVGSCNRQNFDSCYNEAYSYFLRGELTRAVSGYIKCVSFIEPKDSRIAAYTYRDLANICHLEGNNKMAYELNEKSVYYFSKTGNNFEYNDALCSSAVYKAYLGNREETITQLRYICSLTQDSIIQNIAMTYSQQLQSNQLPVLNKYQIHASAAELYTAVKILKYELYKKPFLIKIIVLVLVFLCLFLGIYATHSGLLEHLSNLRMEKERYQQRYVDDIVKFCDFLHDYPENIRKELHWGTYSQMCDVVDMKFGGLMKKLSNNNTLNETEKRLCVLVFIGLTRKQIADILPYASNSVGKLKYTVAKKLQTNGQNLQKMMRNMVLTYS